MNLGTPEGAHSKECHAYLLRQIRLCRTPRTQEERGFFSTLRSAAHISPIRIQAAEIKGLPSMYTASLGGNFSEWH